ncbi:hypothetical protein [Desulfobotulus sp.]|uniref:hypothetical protein n=1 Tax=Desulfobotulus sp. TaxID=1940337 RepID=UPI002A35AAEB|nr:hypothetical protein [Desulfobotulus sp.]MDY0164315.1 hypothetical protein [Desulfobotulus sp.]
MADRKKQTDPLVGMEAIARYVHRSPATILGWVQERGFPAKKIDGRWESSVSLIDDWRAQQIREAS